MIQNELGRSWLRAQAAAFVPPGTVRYFTNELTIKLGVNALGMQVDLAPIEGTVIHAQEEFSVVQTSSDRFTIVDPAVLGTPLIIGSHVRLTPYQRRRFDGSTFQDPVETAERPGGVLARTFHIGTSVSEIPLPAPESEYLQNMQELLHRGKCADGVRLISNMLVDFNAKNLAWQEPEAGPDGRQKDAQFRFDCATGKFVGQVRIGYDRGEDTYYVEMLKEGASGAYEITHSCRSVYADMLAEVLEMLLCDGHWKLCKVEVLRNAQPGNSRSEAMSLTFQRS